MGDSMPRISAFARRHSPVLIEPALPAVTCTAQSNYLTGLRPEGHGIVANGWYDRRLSEVQFWKQSNRLVGAPKVWDALHARNPKLKVANLFWWYNMGTAADIADSLEHWHTSGAADGFNILSLTYPDGLADVVDHVVPELQRRGLFRKEYEGKTLRENLGLDRPENRYAKARRQSAAE